MKSCFNAVSTLLAAVCAILFVFVASLTLLAFVGDQLLFNAGTYKQALRGQHIYERLPELISEQIIYQEQQNTPATGLVLELKRLSQSDWETLISQLATPDLLKTQAESLIDQFITYLNTPSAPLRLHVSLVDFKRRLEGDAGYQAITQIINAQPACTTQEWDTFINSNSYQFEDIPFCRPPEEVIAVAEPYIRTALHDLTPALPDEIDLDNPGGASTASAPAKDRRVELQRVHRWILVSLFLPAGLLALTLVFGVRSLAGCSIWLGIPLLLTGLSTFFAALITWRLPGVLLGRFGPGGQATISGVAPGVSQALVDVGTAIFRSAATTLGIVGVALAVLGGGILAAGLLFGMSQRANF